MVGALDKSVGKIIAALEQWKLRDRTLVIFTSDNGGYLSYGHRFQNISSNGRLRGQKGSMYEGGHRVPTIFSWAGVISPGVTKETAHSTDLLPTFAALAREKTEHLGLDGLDLSELLFHRKALPTRMLFWRAGSERAVRHGPWKLCVTHHGTQLYNLARDLGEQNDLAQERPDMVDGMTRAWNAWERDVNDSVRNH
jgi:arylsulfatase A-like enzyme